MKDSQVKKLSKKQQQLVITAENLFKKHGIKRVTIEEICQKAGVSKKMSPHRIRHSSITAVLDATNGDVRKAQQLSRHANINTVMTYDDNRTNHQGEMSQLLDDLV